MKYLISACLMGDNCKYNGGNNVNTNLINFMKDKTYITVCPEVLGGLSTPRACAEIMDGRIINKDQIDVSEAFYQGAQIALEIALKEDVDMVITQSRSPSCGKGKRYSGNFDQTLIDGNGVFVDSLEAHGVKVMDVGEFIQKIQKKSENVV